MAQPEEPNSQSQCERRVLVINDQEDVAGQLRTRYPDWDIRVSETYLSAIADLSEQPVGAIFAYVDSSDTELDKAVAGLRDAAGSDARLLLCCRADAEPATRAALDSGADDYLICPLRADEVEAALASQRDSDGTPASIPPASIDELKSLGEIVSRLDAPPDSFLASLADLLRTAFGARSAGVVVEGAAATSGGGVSEPVMTEPLTHDGKAIGHVALGPPVSTSGDTFDRSKLAHYARLIGHLITAASDHRRYHDLAYTDELSGLPNRRYLLEFLSGLIERTRTDGTTVTLLMFDVDYFKRYNDTYGHDAGDEIIRGCGELFRRNCREHDVVTRYGGDEFAVVFWDKGRTREPGSQHPSELLPIIERFRRSLKDHRFAGISMAEGSRLTISGGLASFPTDASSVEELITRADEALLLAKREGKNRICIGGKNGGTALDDQRLTIDD